MPIAHRAETDACQGFGEHAARFLRIALRAPMEQIETPIEPLTGLQRRIFTLAAQGYSNREIAHETMYSLQYLKNVWWDAYKRLGIWGDKRYGDKRTRAVILAWKEGMIEVPVRVFPRRVA